MFSGFARCSGLPPTGDNVAVAVDPAAQNAHRIVGYDGPLRAEIGLPATILALPVLWTSVYLLVVACVSRGSARPEGTVRGGK